MFSRNTAYNGGAIHTDVDGHIFLRGNSTSVFHNNIANNCGGATFGTITFDDKSTVTFTDNKATCGATGSTVYSNGNSKVIAKENPTIIFNGQLANWCANACLQYTGQGDIVTIDNTGTVWCSSYEAFICVTKKCQCNKLEDMLVSLKDRAVINITDTVILSSIISFNYLNRISLIGHNNATVYCIKDSGLTMSHCNNVLIQGIRWIGRGNNKKSY